MKGGIDPNKIQQLMQLNEFEDEEDNYWNIV